jgi:hypothetical protein
MKNVNANGTISEFIEVSIFLDVFEEAVISSLDDNKIINNTATNAPPIPMLIAVVIATALVAAAVVAVVVVMVVVIADVSISFPYGRIEHDATIKALYVSYQNNPR